MALFFTQDDLLCFENRDNFYCFVTIGVLKKNQDCKKMHVVVTKTIFERKSTISVEFMIEYELV